MSTKRQISADDLKMTAFIRLPTAMQMTALKLWLNTDAWGRRKLIPELIAADLYPGEDATAKVEEHLLYLDEAGFLTIYTVDGIECIQLTRPLKADRRGAVPDCPPPPQELPWSSMAVEGARAGVGVSGGASGGESARVRSRERVRAEKRERAEEWAAWEAKQERPSMPERPAILDAPPIGCPDHPNGRFENCGPCGTGKRRHDKWLAERRYEEQMRRYEEAMGDEDEYPF